MEISTSIDRGAVVDEVIDIDLDFSTDQLHDSEDNDYIAEKENSIIPQQCSVEYSARDVRDDNTTINGHSLQDMGASASGREDDLGDAELAGQGGNGDMEPISTSTDGLNRFAQPRGNYMQIQDQDNLISPTDQRYSRWPDYINTYERQISDVLPLSAATPAAEFHDGQNLRDISSPFRSTDDIEQELVQISVPSELDPGNESLEMSGSTWDVTPSEDASVAHIPPSLVGSSLVPRDESEPHQTDALEVLTYLHPVIVIYQDNEMSLFPPINQDHEHSQTYFLDNESYASESIGSLLSACRTVLAESIEEEEELQIMIHKMGLCISESTVESSTTTLVQIVDLYVQLHIQDGLEDIAPLYLTLSTTTRFAYRINYLHRAVSEGKGFSKLSIFHQTNEEIQDTNAPDLVTIEAESQSEPQVKEKSYSSVSIGLVSKIGSQESLYGLVGKHEGVDHYPQTTGLSSQDSIGDSKERELSEQANPHQLKDQTSSSSVESSIDNVRNPGIPGNFTNIPEAKQTEESQISFSKTVTTVPTQEEKRTFEDGDLVIDDHEDFPIPAEVVPKSPLGSLPEPVVSIQAPESPSVFDEARNHSRYSNGDWSQGSTQRPYIGDSFKFRGTKAEGKEIQINSLQDDTNINFTRQVGTKESNDKDTSTVIELDTRDESLRGARKLSISQGYNPNIDNETDINNHHDSLDSADFISVHGTLNKYDELPLAHELVRENSKASGSDILEINNLDYENQITGNSVIEDISNPKADDIVLAGAFDSEHISLIPKCQLQTNFQIGSFSDCDEITYDEDENHYEDLKEIYFEHDMNSKLGLLKRVRNDTAESPMVCSDHQDAKRFRSE